MPVDMQKNVSVQVDSDFALLLPSGVYEIKKMEPRSKIRTIILFCLFLAIAGIIGFGYFCQDQVCILCCLYALLWFVQQINLNPYNENGINLASSSEYKKKRCRS